MIKLDKNDIDVIKKAVDSKGYKMRKSSGNYIIEDVNFYMEIGDGNPQFVIFTNDTIRVTVWFSANVPGDICRFITDWERLLKNIERVLETEEQISKICNELTFEHGGPYKSDFMRMLYFHAVGIRFFDENDDISVILYNNAKRCEIG